METKEFEFKGTKVSGFIGLLLLLACIAGIALTNVYLLSYSHSENFACKITQNKAESSKNLQKT